MNSATQEALLTRIFAFYVHGKSLKSLMEYLKPDDIPHFGKGHPMLMIMWDAALEHADNLSRYHDNLGLDFTVTSSYRPLDRSSTHGQFPFLALDVRTKLSRTRFYVNEGLRAVGFTRLSPLYLHGHTHADIGNYIDPSRWDSRVEWNTLRSQFATEQQRIADAQD